MIKIIAIDLDGTLFDDKKNISIENKIKLRNGRVYKEVGNGYGMYADNGETFRLK